MTCQNCGRRVPLRAEQCPHCGAPVEHPAGAQDVTARWQAWSRGEEPQRATPPGSRPATGSPPAALRVVTGREEYTLDTTTTGLLHLAVLGSPHPSARILSIDASAALAMPGVVAVLTHLDSPATLFSTGRHQNREDDPDDTLVLDPVLRYAGQRVAAVVAESIGAAERALGAGGVLPPLLAAWAPNLLFGAGAVYLLLTART